MVSGIGRPGHLQAVKDAVDGIEGEIVRGIAHTRQESQLNRTQAISLKIAGLTYDQIAERMAVPVDRVKYWVKDTLASAQTQAVNEMRALENERLDASLRSVWSEVLKGDHDAIRVFMGIHDRKARINGLNAPTRVEMGVTMRKEVEESLNALEQMIIAGEVVTEPPMPNWEATPPAPAALPPASPAPAPEQDELPLDVDDD